MKALETLGFIGVSRSAYRGTYQARGQSYQAVCACARVRACVRGCTRVRVYACTRVRVCACARVCTRVRVCIGAGEGTPYNIEMAAWGSGSDTECVLGLFGNGVTLFSNPNQQ